MVSKKPVSTKEISVFIIDDHPIVREGLRLGIKLNSSIQVTGMADDIFQATKELKRKLPDVLVLDLLLRASSGLDFLKKIKVEHPGLQVLVLSAHDEGEYAERALRAGARGYIMKQESMDQLIAAIKSVANGEIYLSENMKVRILEKLVKKPEGDPTSPMGLLSDRELEIFKSVGDGFETKQIAERLHLSVKTVEAHYANIKRKMDLENSHQLSRAALRWTHNMHPL